MDMFIPNSARLRNPNRLVAVVSNPKTSAPKLSIRIFREKNPRSRWTILKNRDTRAFFMLNFVRLFFDISILC